MKTFKLVCSNCHSENTVLVVGDALYAPVAQRVVPKKRKVVAAKKSGRYSMTAKKCPRGCGRVFTSPQGYAGHSRFCKGGK